MTSELGRLLELADQILAPDLPDEEVVALIQEYAEAFSSWCESDAVRGDLGNVEKTYGAERVRRLSAQHRLVLEKASALKDATSSELRNLKRRGKGILAYTDTLPKRISVRRNRKG